MKKNVATHSVFTAESSLFWLTFLIALGGLLTILSSQSDAARPLFLAGRQAVHLTVALAALLLCASVPFRFYRRAAAWLRALAALPLFLLPLWGTRINGARGWFRFGEFCYQPAEIAKVFLR